MVNLQMTKAEAAEAAEAQEMFVCDLEAPTKAFYGMPFCNLPAEQWRGRLQIEMQCACEWGAPSNVALLTNPKTALRCPSGAMGGSPAPAGCSKCAEMSPNLHRNCFLARVSFVPNRPQSGSWESFRKYLDHAQSANAEVVTVDAIRDRMPER